MGVPQLSHGDAGFAEHLEGLVFNKLRFDRAPDLVVSPRTEDEVIAAVRDAAASGRKVAVLSGGHSWVAAPLRESGVLIDMSAFTSISIDGQARTARVGPAARGGDVARALAAEGFCYSSGHCGTPGTGGYLLGGGLGLNWGHWKPACYAVRSVRVVTASGELVTATATENRDLWWLARGSGPAFPGVVTEFEIELQDRPQATHVSSWVFDFEDIAAVGRWVTEVSRELPTHVEVITAAGGPNRHEHLPADGFPDRIVTVLAIAYVDSSEEARAALAPFAGGPDFPALAADELELVAFEELSAAFDAEYPEDHCYIADAFWTDLDLEATTVALKEKFTEAPSGMNNFVVMMPGHGEPLGLDPDEGAYSIDKRTLAMAYAIFGEQEAAEPNRQWMTSMSALLEQISSGHFVSECDIRSYPRRLPGSFSEQSWARILELRAKLDPLAMFGLPCDDA
jgi:FAD/FMN-containing dehydrogenase